MRNRARAVAVLIGLAAPVDAQAPVEARIPELLHALRFGDDPAWAATVLAELGPSAHRALLGLLRDPDRGPSRGSAIADAFGALDAGDAGLVMGLIAAGERSPRACAALLAAIGRPARPALPAMHRWAARRDAEVRLSIERLQTSAVLRVEPRSPPVVPAVDDPVAALADAATRWLAVQSLLARGEGGAFIAYVELLDLAVAADDPTRASCLRQAEYVRCQAAATAVLDRSILRRLDVSIREPQLRLAAVAGVDRHESREWLVELLAADSPGLRSAALVGLSHGPQLSCVHLSAVEHAVADPDPGVQRVAILVAAHLRRARVERDTALLAEARDSFDEPAQRLRLLIRLREIGPGAAPLIDTLLPWAFGQDGMAGLAREVLVAIGTAAEPALVAAWSDADAIARRDILAMLGRIGVGTEDGYRVVLTMLSSSDSMLRHGAVTALRSVEVSSATDWFERALRDPAQVDAALQGLDDLTRSDPEWRAAAAAWAPILAVDLVTASKARCDVVFAILPRLGSPGAEALASVARGDGPGELRIRAVRALGRAEAASVALAALAGLRDDPDAAVAAAVLDGLQTLGRPPAELVPSLQRVWDRADPKTRAWLARTVAAIGEPAAVMLGVLLVAAGQTDDLGIRAAVAVGAIDPAGAGGELLRARLTAGDQEVRYRVLWWLTGSPATLAPYQPELIAALADRDPRIVTAAVRGLERIGPPAAAALPILRELRRTAESVLEQQLLQAIDAIEGR